MINSSWRRVVAAATGNPGWSLESPLLLGRREPAKRCPGTQGASPNLDGGYSGLGSDSSRAGFSATPNPPPQLLGAGAHTSDAECATCRPGTHSPSRQRPRKAGLSQLPPTGAATLPEVQSDQTIFFFLVHNHALCTDTAAGALRAMSPCPAHSLGADTLFLIRCDRLPHKRPPWAPPAAPSMSLYSSRTLFTQESLGQSKRDTTVAGVTVPPFIKHPSARPGVRTSPRRAASSWDGPRPILPARDPPARRVPPRPHPASPLPRLAVWQRDLRRPAGPATSKSGAREAASYSSASDTARASLVFAHLESPKNPGWSPFYGEELEGESHHPD